MYLSNVSPGPIFSVVKKTLLYLDNIEPQDQSFYKTKSFYTKSACYVRLRSWLTPPALCVVWVVAVSIGQYTQHNRGHHAAAAQIKQ